MKSYDKLAVELTLAWSIASQATCFNESCRVWAPYYRQCAIGALTNPKPREIAYSDVKRAFEYFLANLPSDTSPIVLASHSQGTFHLTRLVEELFEPNEALRSRLVCAYLVGGKDTHLYSQVLGDLPIKYFDLINVKFEINNQHCRIHTHDFLLKLLDIIFIRKV